MSKRYDKLQKEFEQIKTDIAVLESKRVDMKKILLSDFKCKTIAEAYKKAEMFSGQSEALEKTIEALLDEAEEIINGDEEEED